MSEFHYESRKSASYLKAKFHLRPDLETGSRVKLMDFSDDLPKHIECGTILCRDYDVAFVKWDDGVQTPHLINHLILVSNPKNLNDFVSIW